MIQEYPSVHEYMAAFRQDRTLAYFTIGHTAKLLGVNRQTIERMIESNRLDGIKTGKTLFVRASSVDFKVTTQEQDFGFVYNYLENCAKNKRLTAYEPIMTPINLDHSLSRDRAVIAKILEKVSIKSFEESKDRYRSGRGILLSALVVKKVNGKLTIPSKGFFAMAEGMGFTWNDAVEFAEKQAKRVFAYY